ncbi:choline dehydrogenase [Stachybotrys elegans]|uniref:Choline dehydrogenase n=1 Tax=Stachybotrys elegans TaxID=80388 RepID=A0A8K0S893_9HYPO|nr:choline dehydrogenase [Stachybotrys elegans]
MQTTFTPGFGVQGGVSIEIARDCWAWLENLNSWVILPTLRGWPRHPNLCPWLCSSTSSMAFAIKSLVAFAALAGASPGVPNTTRRADYVIVGAGPAGFVVAEYLTRDPSLKVVLLEAGPDGDTDPLLTTPADFINTGEYMWPYSAQPDPNLGGQTPNIVQGRALGGGSACNAMLYCRGSASVFDEWAQISGNEGLRWSSMLDAFKATTHWQDGVDIDYVQPINTSMVGHGPLEITRQRELLTLDKPFADMLQSTLNLTQIDFLSGQGIGVTQGLESIRASNSTRHYAYNTFGYLATQRLNFELHHDAWVMNVGFTGETADRVTYNDTLTGTVHTVEAKEIIISAGAINSPQLLMLSGVGPANELRAHGIPVVKDVPQVGQNLVNHHYAVVQYEAKSSVDTYWQVFDNGTSEAIETAMYHANGDGFLGSIIGDVSGAFRLPDSVFDGMGTFYKDLPADRPHIIFQYFAGAFLPGPNVSTVSAFAAVVQPESTGNITLASASYRDAPLIYANYWGSPADKAAVVYGYKQLRAIFRSPEIFGQYLTRELNPGDDVVTDEQLWAAIQETSNSWHHPVGTVALGTVLDANWRVKGLKGLRVIGSAAAPKITTCAPQGTIYAMGHRAALDIAAADGVCGEC